MSSKILQMGLVMRFRFLLTIFHSLGVISVLFLIHVPCSFLNWDWKTDILSGDSIVSLCDYQVVVRHVVLFTLYSIVMGLIKV